MTVTLPRQLLCHLWVVCLHSSHSFKMQISQVAVIYSRAIFVARTSECSVKRVICKIWTRTVVNTADPDQRPQNAASDQSLTVCLIYRKLRVK